MHDDNRPYVIFKDGKIMMVDDIEELPEVLESTLQLGRSELMTKKINYSSNMTFGKWLQEVYLSVVLVTNRLEQFSSKVGMSEEQMITLTNLCDNQILSLNIKQYN